MPQEFVLNIIPDEQSFQSFEERLSALDILAQPSARSVVSAIREIHISALALLDFSDVAAGHEHQPSDAERANMTKQLVHQRLAAIGIDFNPRAIKIFKEENQVNIHFIQIDLENISDIIGSIMTEKEKYDPETLLLQEIQKDVDAILRGDLEPVPARAGQDANRLFAGFLPEDRDLASRLSGDSMRIANKTGGVMGLRLAVDHLKTAIGNYPVGTVERATKLFITHHPLAREQLVIMPLERRVSGPHSPMP